MSKRKIKNAAENIVTNENIVFQERGFNNNDISAEQIDNDQKKRSLVVSLFSMFQMQSGSLNIPSFSERTRT
jgi:hypothetical protein